MKLYYAEGTCALGIHLLLEELGLAYDSYAVNLRAGEHFAPEYLAVNPKSRVPALGLDDGSVLTEFPAIAYYLAERHPHAQLMPADPVARARVMEAMMFINGTMHLAGFGRIFRPASFCENPDEKAAVKKKGMEIFTGGFALIAKQLGAQDYLVGSFSIADAALFYVTFWAKSFSIGIPPVIDAHYARMLARPAVTRTMELEGLAA
jgi:glutathione S-transferase